MSSLFRKLRRIHNDEQGMEALQVVMIIALAAVVLFFIRNYWTTIQTWLNGATTNITQWTTG